MTAISVVALVISVLALVFTAWAAYATAMQAKSAQAQTEIQHQQVLAAKEQTALQRELAREALQPYVWADIEPDLKQGTLLYVVVGNIGPTVARNVTVTFDPPLPADERWADAVEEVQRMLRTGLRSLAPNREHRWTLGVSFNLMASDASQLRTVCVEADGPHGPIPTLEVEFDISEWRSTRDDPDGSLHQVRGAIQDLTKAVGGVKAAIDRVDQVESSKRETIRLNELKDSVNRAMPPQPGEEKASGSG